MKNSKQIRESIGEVNTRLADLDTVVTAEDRDFTDAEQTAYDNDMADLTRLMDELPKVELSEQTRLKASSLAGTPIVKGEERELDKIAKDFSFGAAVRAAYGVKLDGVEAEMDQLGQEEMHRIGKSANGVVIPSSILNRAVITESGTTGVEARNFVDSVYAGTILGDLGITRFDAVTDQRIPILGAVTTQWETETSDAADGGAVSTKVDLAPKRLASYLDYSKQAAMQANYSLESALRNNIAMSVAAKVEYAAFTDDTANGSYEWLGNDKTALNNTDLTTLVLAIIEQVKGNNHDRGNVGFAIDTDLFGDVYTAILATGVSPLLANEMILGRMAKFSNQMAQISSQDVIYYGDWSKVQMAQFGGIEILNDPYTQAIGGKNRLVLNSYWDMALVQDAALSVGRLGA
jgi:HK97 family phage major capsid protein